MGKFGTFLQVLIVAVCLPTLQNPISTSKAAVPNPTYTVTFANNSSALSSTASKTLRNWKVTLNQASKITVTGFAPAGTSTTRQIALAKKRSSVVIAQLKSIGVSTTFVSKFIVENKKITNQAKSNKATIFINSLKAKPSSTPSSSATPTASPTITPSTSPTPSQSPLFKFSGSVRLDFVDCNEVDPQNPRQQVLGTEISLTSLTNPQEVYKLNLDANQTKRAASSNNMNCKIDWSDFKVPAGNYKAKMRVVCQTTQSVDADLNAATACTPSTFVYLKGTDAVELSGDGPTAENIGFSMNVSIPGDVSIASDQSLDFYAWAK